MALTHSELFALLFVLLFALFVRDRSVVVLWILSGWLFSGFSLFWRHDRIPDVAVILSRPRRVVAPQAILSGLLVSLFLGLLFGVSPAHHAAHLPPVELIKG